ncbi:unnamed protein product [Clavelina lepadiformis]|uniref:Uncharacterized protein n=1 Tax=Clavelina lepadiformis TaxID=159417 RepID=A0ABP0FTU0_CLALP
MACEPDPALFMMRVVVRTTFKCGIHLYFYIVVFLITVLLYAEAGKCPNVECDKKCKDEHKEKDDNGCTTCRCTKQLGDLLLTEAQINWIDDREKSGDGSPRAASSVVKKWTRDVTADGYYRIPYNYSDDIRKSKAFKIFRELAALSS